MRNDWPKVRPLSLDRQAALVRLSYPAFTTRMEHGGLTIEGTIQPTSMSEEYRVRIEYAWNHAPRVIVLSPELERHESGDEIPHRHTDEGRPLCLYFAKNREWSSFDPISETTIPWTAEWLFFYEIWRATRSWIGGGIDHAPATVPVEEVAVNG